MQKLKNTLCFKYISLVKGSIFLITYANKFPYIILLTATDQYFSISGV